MQLELLYLGNAKVWVWEETVLCVCKGKGKGTGKQTKVQAKVQAKTKTKAKAKPTPKPTPTPLRFPGSSSCTMNCHHDLIKLCSYHSRMGDEGTSGLPQ